MSYTVIVRVNTRQPKKAIVRDRWLPRDLWPTFHYTGKVDSGVDWLDPDRTMYWDHVWSGTFGQAAFDRFFRAVVDGFDPEHYIGQQGGMLSPVGWRGLIPDLRWEAIPGGSDDEAMISVCPFPALFATNALRMLYDFADWETLARAFERRYGLVEQENLIVSGFQAVA